MSTLREASEQYLQLRRDLGYKLRGAGRLLQNFVAFAEREGASHVTTDLALRWAQQPVGRPAGDLGFAPPGGAPFRRLAQRLGSTHGSAARRPAALPLSSGSGRTSTATRRSGISSGQPVDSLRPRD